MLNRNISTPWGMSQTFRTIAEGIDIVSTAGHGGIRLSAARAAALQKLMPGQTTWVGSDRWYEEDSDVHLVVLAFPECFEDASVFYAVKGVERSDYMAPARAYLASEGGAALRERARKFEESVKDKWEVTSYGTPRGANRDAWGVGLRNAATGARKQVDFLKMPTKAFYSDAEIADVMVNP